MAKAWSIPHLNPDQDLNTCLTKILRTRFSEMLSYEKGTLEGSDIEALHDMRVSSRRIQSVLKIFRGAYPAKKFKKQYSRIRALKNFLGEVRHYDVFIEMLEKYRDNAADKDRKAVELLIVRQKTLREESRKMFIKYINNLNKQGYKESFNSFISNL